MTEVGHPDEDLDEMNTEMLWILQIGPRRPLQPSVRVKNVNPIFFQISLDNRF